MNILKLFLIFLPISMARMIDLTSTNMVSIRGPISSYSASKFVKETTDFESSELNIFINSPGGSISDGNIIIEQIKSLNNSGKTVNCISEFAASMAFIITQSCPNRYALSSSVLMQHQMSLGIKGEINRINSYLNYIEELKNSIDTMQSKRIGLDLDTFQEKVKDEWWVYGENLVKNNIVDEIILVRCHDSLKNFKDIVKISSFFGSIELNYIGCPLTREPSKIVWNNIDKDKAMELAYDYIRSPYKFIEFSIN